MKIKLVYIAQHLDGKSAQEYAQNMGYDYEYINTDYPFTKYMQFDSKYDWVICMDENCVIESYTSFSLNDTFALMIYEDMFKTERVFNSFLLAINTTHPKTQIILQSIITFLLSKKYSSYIVRSKHSVSYLDLMKNFIISNREYMNCIGVDTFPSFLSCCYDYELCRSLKFNSVNYKVFILYYDEKTKNIAECQYRQFWANKLFNNTTKYLEAFAIFDTLPNIKNQWKNLDYVGLLSWKAYQKIDLPSNFYLLEKAKKYDIDVIDLYYNQETRSFNIIFEKDYPFLNKIWRRLMNLLKINENLEVKNFICNYWFMKPSVLDRFIVFVDKVKNTIESDPIISSLINMDSQYSRTPPETYIKNVGKDYYTCHAFMMERLACVFTTINKLKCMSYSRLDDIEYFNGIKNFNLEGDHVIIYIYKGNKENFNILYKKPVNVDLIVVSQDLLSVSGIYNVIVNDIQNTLQIISDVVLNIKQYKSYMFINDDILIGHSNIVNMFIQKLDNIHRLITVPSKYKFNFNCFCIDNVLYNTIKDSVFKEVIYKYTENTMMDFCLDVYTFISDNGYSLTILPFFPNSVLQTWKEKTISNKIISSWHESWKICNPEYIHIFSDDKDNRNFVKDNFCEFLNIYDLYDKNIKRVDAFRILYLLKRGGIYADVDFQCIRSFDSILKYGNEKEADVILGYVDLEERYFLHTIPNALMIAKKNTDFFKFLYDVLKNIGIDDNLSPEEATGPVFLMICYQYYVNSINLSSQYYSRDIFENINPARTSKIEILGDKLFYPISWKNEEHKKYAREITIEEARSLFPESYALTYWMGSWK